MSSDETRPILTNAYLDNYHDTLVLVATDSYKLVAIQLGEADMVLAGRFIPRAELIKWYKLAATRDLLTLEVIAGMAIVDNDSKYPAWQKLLDKQEEETDPKYTGATDSISFNASYALTLEKLAGQSLSYQLNGYMGQMQATTDDGLYILMPLKAK